MPRWLVPIAEAQDSDRFGGKAASLARLAREGFPVPPAVALPVEALEAFLEQNALEGLVRRAARGPGAADQLAKGIVAGRLPPDMAAELRALSLGDRLVVRSSAVGEDGAEKSFAGQFLTVPNVRPGDALEEAIRACWASAWSGHARAYEGRALPMALVIQRLVDARAAGVLFTVDPVSGSWAEMVVEAAFGQGEALVSGQVAPDRYRLRRPRAWPGPLGRLAGRLRVEEIEADVVEQPQQLSPTSAGFSWVPAPSGRKLGPEQVRKLGRMGLRVERLHGAPQDLEWAEDRDGELQLLQARPITAAGAPQRGGDVLWTRRFIGERWGGMASPLGWSLMGGIIDWFIDYPEVSSRHLGGGPPTRLLRGWPYLNATVFRHLAFKLPGRPAPRFMLDLLPPEEAARWTQRFAGPPDLAVYRDIFRTTFAERRWRRFRWNPLTNHLAWEGFKGRLDAELLGMAAMAPAAAAARGAELVREYVKIHIISLLLANLFYEVLEGVLDPDLREPLLRSPPGNPTVEVNRALWSLARSGELEPFLARYGHRCSGASWELFTERWAEDPAQVLALAEGFRELPDPGLQEAAHSEAAAAALDRLRRRRPALLPAVGLARKHLLLREEQRFHFDRLSWALKRAVLAAWGPEARWLLWSELDSGGPAETRRAQWAAWEKLPPPPEFLVGDREVEVGLASAVLRGLGISSGRATGAVRVIRSPAEGHKLQRGEVLVATATDPGWTPLFLRASAVVLEMGSMLSHGAVIAREYGLPAVVNVANATTRLRDGQRVTVDGGRGEVRVEALG